MKEWLVNLDRKEKIIFFFLRKDDSHSWYDRSDKVILRWNIAILFRGHSV